MSSSSDFKIFNLNDQSQIEVKKIIVLGNDRTKLDYFQHELNTQLHSIAAVKTSPNSYKLPFSALYSNLHTFTARLLSSDLFEIADTNLQIDKFISDESKYEATLKITVKEKGIPFLRTQSYVRTGKETDVGAELTGALRNPLGYGDQWKISTISKQQGSREFVASVAFPHIPNTSNDHTISIPTEKCTIPNIFDISPTCPLTITAKSCTENGSELSPFKLSCTSFSVDYNYPNNKHLWSLEYSIRDEIPFLNSSRRINTNGNPTEKNSSTHSLWKDMIPQSTLWVSSPFSFSDKLNPDVGDDTKGKSIVSSANDNIHPLFLGLLSSSIKSSLKYMFTPIDTRDSASLPTKGSFLQSQLELATYPGNTHFLKAELMSQYHKTFHPFGGENKAEKGITLSLAGNLGLLIPVAYYTTMLWNGLFGGQSAINTANASTEHDSYHHSSHALPRPSYLSDRFFTGGPLVLRGFNLHGVGPRASHTLNHQHHSHRSTSNHVNSYDNNGLSLGGDSRSAFLAMIAFPLPESWTTSLVRSLQLRTIYFLNVGTLGNADYWSWQHLHATTKDLIASRLPNHQHSSTNTHHVQGLLSSSLFGHLRASVGTGISCNLGSAVRLEATYSVPFMYNAHDVLHPFQFGIGVSIM